MKRPVSRITVSPLGGCSLALPKKVISVSCSLELIYPREREPQCWSMDTRAI